MELVAVEETVAESKVDGRSRKAKGERPETTAFLPPSAYILPPLLLAIALSWLFWGPLWEGGSLIGGDLYPYFFPQKVFLAEQLRAGVVPLWNPFTGDGYPTIAESQTGVCYPPDLLAYRFIPVTQAYNYLQILHYIFGFVGTWLFARRLGANIGGALLAAVSFIYGWFPARICLEWAIITGSYLPWVMWCAESYLQQPRKRWLLGLCALLALQLLAGHFHLAFLTQLTLFVYAPLRWWILPLREPEALARKDEPRGLASASGFLPIWTAIAIAFILAAVQLLPTWELKQRSQRSEISAEHQPGYGHLPPRYWTQVFGPWVWYMGEKIDEPRHGKKIDESLQQMPGYAGGAGTNQAEAHLYFGLIPLALALGGWIAAWRGRTETDYVLRLWFVIGLAFLLYTPGWFLPIAQHLPGFNFFRGPGRYGLITSFAVAITSGVTFSRLRLPGRWRTPITILVLLITTAELWWVAQLVGYSELRLFTVVEHRGESPLKQLLAKEPQPVRLFAPMANVANLLDVSSTPVYLGIGPAEYFDPQYTLPVGPQGGLDPAGNPQQIQWLRQAGVTHILALERMNPQHWPIELAWNGPDPFLGIIFGSPREPFYLYRLKESTGRSVWEYADDKATSEITNYSAHRVELRANSTSGGTLVLRDLAYPGWQVDVDGTPQPTATSGMFRAVQLSPGEHHVVWSYRPRSVYWGSLISVITLLGLLSASVLWRRSNIVALPTSNQQPPTHQSP